MRTIITTTTINRVVTGNAGRVVVGTDGDMRTHFSAAPRSSRVHANRLASYRASLALGCEHLVRAVGTLAQAALGWFQEPAKRLMPAQANKCLCAACRPATGLHRLRG